MRDRLTSLTKKQRFLAILVALGVLGFGISMMVKLAVVTKESDEFFRIAVAGPLEGGDKAKGRSLQYGVQLYVDQINKAGGVAGRRIELEVLDDGDSIAGAIEISKKIIQDWEILGIIGHTSDRTARAAVPQYRQAGIPLITPASLIPDLTGGSNWHFATAFNQTQQASFLANYARNIMGRKLTSIIADTDNFDATLAIPYEETYKRFGTAIRYKWSFDATSGNRDQALAAIVAELKSKKDAGAVFLAVGAQDGARLVKMMREAGVRNPLIGPSALASDAFTQSLAAQVSPKSTADYLDRITVASPLVFDTANESAQNFFNAYKKAYGIAPDWVAAHAYDSAQLLLKTLKTAVAANEGSDIAAWRADIQNGLLAHKDLGSAFPGVTGSLFFDAKGEGQTPVLIGRYDGKSLISALTQLQPITGKVATNYIDELKKGRMLYVNDRFMYKTNVVYTGIQLNEVVEIKPEENKATLDFTLWFRYRGNFEPQDLSFPNALQPIVLDKPEKEGLLGDMTYRRYRVKGDFALNFTDTSRFYGSHVLGLTFTHQQLNRNNLLFVVDVLGLGMDKGGTVQGMVDDARALSPAMGWLLDRAWISQDVVSKGTLGDPAYVGYSAAASNFSKIDYGVLLKPDQITVRDFVPFEYFLYIGIFGLLGTVCAVWMDRKEKGRFWHAQSWGLRAVSWPFLLLAGGNLLLDVAFRNLTPNIIDMIVVVYDTLWWFVPAVLAHIALERFLWVPLEDHTERNIPNVVRVFAAMTVYSLATFGVVAFVFGQQLTSLLATSGLLAMIIGLAVQSNIANVFSGIVLNVERPFKVGDWVRMGDQDEGRVVDITWRTTRIKTRNGYVISVPNGIVSEAEVHNFSSFDKIRMELPLYLHAGYDPQRASDIMEEGLAKAINIADKPEREVRFKGIHWDHGWISTFEIQFWINNYGGKEEIAEGAITCVWNELYKHGIKADQPALSAGGKDTKLAPA